MEATVKVQKLSHAEDLPLPTYATEGAAAVDLRAAIFGPIAIQPSTSTLIPTGIRLQLPPNTRAEIRGCSGLASKFNVYCFNGLIDEDYLGEVSVLLQNCGSKDFIVHRGDMIAQLLFSPPPPPTGNIPIG